MTSSLVKPYWVRVGTGGWQTTPEGLVDAFRKTPQDAPTLDELASVNRNNPRAAEGLILIPGDWSEPKDGPIWEHMVPFAPSTTSCDAGKAERKPYRYRVQKSERPWTIAQKFGQPYGAWVRLRQANYDDPGGFQRPAADCGACGFADWNPGKFVWIPAEWPDPPKTSPLWNFIESSYPTARDAGQVGAPDDGEHNMIRHTIKRGETSGSIARNYGVSKDAVLDANPQLAKGVTAGERDFVREHFKVDGVLNVPTGAVGAPPSGQVGCGGGCGSPNPWAQMPAQPMNANGHLAGCGCAACRPLGPAPMCLPTDGQWAPSFPWGGFPNQQMGAGGWNPSFPWGAAMGVEHLTRAPAYAGPGCGTCGAPPGQLGKAGDSVACPGGVAAREDVRYVLQPDDYGPAYVAAKFGLPNNRRGEITAANQGWPQCVEDSGGTPMIAPWTLGTTRIKLPLSWFGAGEEYWTPKAYAGLRMKDPVSGEWTAPYIKNSMPGTGGCKPGEANIAGVCYPLPVGVTVPPVGGQCPAGTTNVGGYCVPTGGYPPITGLGCLPGTTLQNGVCVLPGGVTPGVPPVGGACPTGMTLYSDGKCYVPGSQPTGLTPVAYGDNAAKESGMPTWGWALIGVGIAGAAVLAISAASKSSTSKTTTTRTTVPAHRGKGEVVVVDERAAAHGRRLPAARKSTSRRSR